VNLFLASDELAVLTGIKKGKNGKTRHQLQVEQLRRMGVPFFVNACGQPVVTYAAVEGHHKEPLQQGWKPAIARA
jgi:hypothetical protein